MNKKGLSLFWIFSLIMVVIVLAMAQNHIDTSTIDKTIDALNWSTIGKNVTDSIQRSADNSPNYIASVILNVANKAVDFYGYAIFELTKLAMRLTKDNPSFINYKVLLGLVLLSLIAPLIWPAFLIIVSIILIIKEAFKNSKEKKELKKIKEKSLENES